MKTASEKLTYAYLVFCDGKLCRCLRTKKAALATFADDKRYREDDFRANLKEIARFIGEEGFYGAGTVWTVEKHVLCD